MKSDAGYEQAKSAVRILRSYAKNSPRATNEYHSFGVLQTLSKAFFSQEMQVKKISMEILGSLSLSDEAAVELANLGMISLTLKLMNQQEYEVQYHASCLFKNITSRVNILRSIIQNEDFEGLIEAVHKSSTKEVRFMYLQSLLNLSQIDEVAPELVRYGLIETIGQLYAQDTDMEVVRICAKILDTLCRNEVLIQAVFEGLDMTHLIARMYVTKDVETARISFHICKLFSKIARFHNEVLNRKLDIAPAIFQCLKDKDLPIQ